MKKYKVHKVSDEELKCLQKLGLEMLIEFDRICRKYGIEYSLDGGTLLGAIRHGGFIPWDDDIDVIMLRHEYTKFLRAAKRDLDTERFFLQEYRTDPGYRWGYAKIRRNDTLLVRPYQENWKTHQGVFMDIFVADNVPDNEVLREIHHKLCLAIRKTMYSEVGKYQEKNPVLRGVYSGLSRIPIKKVFAARNTLAKLCNKKRTYLVSHYTSGYPNRTKYGVWRDCFDELIDVDFEGHKFLVFKNYDKYLWGGYGDYMKLPPEKDRVSHMEYTEVKLVNPRRI